ncbi:putative Type 1 galactoside alpha-(1,2)-fucosyltransferase [Lupinus albus]|uniref:Fucosyltransferase n=1 Tax=Lupinus albus TaxID=3870 RepID=A0A6A4NNI2_LUPAL|nr:putative Type 1 galactoside alpha-(1,2)-fucosyltransferase [Lupinus albus]
MEILQSVMSSKKLTTLIIVFFIAFPIALTANLMFRNSRFSIFEVFSENKVAMKNASLANDPTSTSVFSENKVAMKNASLTNDPTSTSNASLTNDPTSTSNASLTNDPTSTSTSCISRLQSHLYRKPSPHKPSPYLIYKLRNYEELHTRCGPNTRAYRRSMMNIVNSNNSSGNAAMCKYLVCVPVNGLGNQMISIAATFLYAVLTDRVLLVRFGEDKYHLFCEPFLNSTWILPKNFPFWNYKLVQTYQTIILNKDRGINSKQDLPSTLFLNLQHTKNHPDKFFHCHHSQHLLSNVPLLILKSDQYFVPALFMNPSFNSEITKMFRERDTVFYHLGRYLFHPSNEVWGLIRKFYEEHLSKADERIGLQIRVFAPDSTPQEAVMDLILSCTIKNKLLPELDTQNSMPYTTKNQSLKVVLVTSLNEEYGENLRKMYENKATVSGEVVRVYQASHEEHQKHHDKMHNMKAWMEMYLLSLCDVLVTTSASTFGYVAQSLGGLRPWLLYKLTNNATHFPACQRDFSLEPCYHIPPNHYCNGNIIKDYVSTFLYLRGCNDFSNGVKLVNDTS